MEPLSSDNIMMDINKPTDYSLSSSETKLKSDINEANNNKSNNNNSNSNTISKSMKLNFGVERLLSRKEDEDNKKIYTKLDESKDKGLLINVVTNNVNIESDNSFQGLNLLHQQLMNTNINGLANQNCILKPFPLRFGKNHNGRIQINNKL